MKVHVLKINEEEEYVEKASRLVKSVSADCVDEKWSTVEVNILSADASLLSGLVIIVANISTKGWKGTPRTEIWMCRCSSDEIVGKKILVGCDVVVFSHKLSSERTRCGLEVCLDAKSVTYIDGGYVEIIGSSRGVRVKMFKSLEILSKED